MLRDVGMLLGDELQDIEFVPVLLFILEHFPPRLNEHIILVLEIVSIFVGLLSHIQYLVGNQRTLKQVIL